MVLPPPSWRISLIPDVCDLLMFIVAQPYVLVEVSLQGVRLRGIGAGQHHAVLSGLICHGIILQFSVGYGTVYSGIRHCIRRWSAQSFARSNVDHHCLSDGAQLIVDDFIEKADGNMFQHVQSAHRDNGQYWFRRYWLKKAACVGRWPQSPGHLDPMLYLNIKNTNTNNNGMI